MNVTQRVSNILGASHAARNSDLELLIIYMQKSGMALSDEQIRTFKAMPSMETIRRTRQKIQMDGKYPADPKVNEARYNKFKNVRQYISFTNEIEEMLR